MELLYPFRVMIDDKLKIICLERIYQYWRFPPRHGVSVAWEKKQQNYCCYTETIFVSISGATKQTFFDKWERFFYQSVVGHSQYLWWYTNGDLKFGILDALWFDLFGFSAVISVETVFKTGLFFLSFPLLPSSSPISEIKILVGLCQFLLVSLSKKIFFILTTDWLLKIVIFCLHFLHTFSDTSGAQSNSPKCSMKKLLR